MMGSESIILWNCAGLRASTDSTAEKFSFFDSQFRDAKFTIAAFVETHHKDGNDFTTDLSQFEQTHFILHTPATNETHSGVIILISKDFDLQSQTVPLPGRIINVKMKRGEKNWSLTVFYGPQWGKMIRDEIVEVI